jgi:hypothetical protein
MERPEETGEHAESAEIKILSAVFEVFAVFSGRVVPGLT